MEPSIGMHVQEELLRAMYMFLAQAVELDRLVRQCASFVSSRCVSSKTSVSIRYYLLILSYTSCEPGSL